MQSVGLQRRLLVSVCLFLRLLTSAESQQVEQLVEEVQNVPVEVITESSPCSATCGLGLRTQTLCLLNDSRKCRVRAVQCMDTWQCGLQTMTVTSGQRVEVDCVGDVMEATGSFKPTFGTAGPDGTVKRAYWGIRVLPVGVLSLDYDSSLALWDEGEKNQTEEEEEQRKIFPFALLAMGVSVAVAGVFAALLRGYEAMKRIRRRRRGI
uniref:Transmembrane protein 81 n=2 Tax=Haplochromini TaxID=319058 RepID=A0A3B4GBG9_9CICH